MTRWAPSAVAALLAIVVSAPSLANGFVYDDVWIVAERESIQSPADPVALLTEPYWPPDRGRAAWRPAVLLAFAAEWALGDGRAIVFHAVNVLLAALTAALVAAVGTLLFGTTAGLVAGALFAVHPVHVEVVANVVGQAELLAAACYLGVLLLAWRYVERGSRRGAGLVLAVAALATVGVGAKEHVVTLPAAVALLWWLAAQRLGRTVGEVGRQSWPVMVAAVVPVVAYLAARASVTGGLADAGGVAPGLDPDNPLQRFVVMLPVSLEWLRLLFGPAHLSADYGPSHLVPRPAFGVLHGIAVLVWGGIAYGAWRVRNRVPAVAFGTALFAVTVAVAANVLVPLEILLAERFLFLPSAGWALAVGGVVSLLATGSVRRRVVLVVGGAVVVVLGIRSIERTAVWSDNATFFAAMWDDAPRSYRNSRRAAQDAFNRGDDAEGLELLGEAAERNPWHVAIATELGVRLVAAGRPAAAVPHLVRALERDPERSETAAALAIALTKAGRGAAALPLLAELERREGPSPQMTLVRIEALRVAGRFAESQAAAERVLADRPDDWLVRLMAAEAALLAGACDAADRHASAGRPKAPEDRRPAFDRVLTFLANGQAACN